MVQILGFRKNWKFICHSVNGEKIHQFELTNLVRPVLSVADILFAYLREQIWLQSNITLCIEITKVFEPNPKDFEYFALFWGRSIFFLNH